MKATRRTKESRTIKRYGLGCDYAIVERADGGYVRLEDYEALAKELSIAQSIIDLGEAIEAHRLARQKERTDLIVEILK